MSIYHIVHYSDGEIYAGELKNYKRHGYGVCIYKNRDVYEGRWLDGKKHGNGSYTCSDGTVYCGNTIGVRWRQGVMVWPANQTFGLNALK